MSVGGWGRAKAVVYESADRLGHVLGGFRRDGRDGGVVLRRAVCRECGCVVTVKRSGGRWVSDVWRKGRCEAVVRRRALRAMRVL